MHSQSWSSLFNGRNLDGWQVPDSNRWYLAQHGILKIRSGPDKKGSILWTAKEYKNFRLRFFFRMIAGTVDSGIFLRGENDQIQIGISGSLKRDMTGSPYIPGLRYPVEAQGVQAILKPSDWNQMEIECIDHTYTVWLNKKRVMQYTSEIIPMLGPIGLQLHPGNEMSIDYKKIQLKVIKSDIK
jgi:hypothetical protein